MAVSSSETSSAVGPFVPDAADLQRLREVLDTHGFLGEGVRAAVGARIGAHHLRRDLPLYLRRLEAPTPLNILVKLLSLGLWVEESAARTALSPVGVDDLLAARLLERGPQGVRALVELVVHRDLVLAHDRLRARARLRSRPRPRARDERARLPPRLPHRPPAGGGVPRPGLRRGRAVVPGRPAQRAGRGGRQEPPRPRVPRVERPTQRSRERRGPRGRSLRPRGGPPVRPRGQQPALRDLARQPLHLHGQRAAGRHHLRRGGEGRARPSRGGRLRDRALQLGAPRR